MAVIAGEEGVPENLRDEVAEDAEPTAVEQQAATGGEEGESAAHEADSEAAREYQAAPPMILQLEVAAPQEPPYEFRGNNIGNACTFQQCFLASFGNNFPACDQNFMKRS
uniref:Uncharacterized protein n=1 Tax=Ascaris lumbricoides TaxID=6252 RepID=A0A0M3HLC4_ASCLU